MATHSSILAWRITWTEEPSGLQSMGSQSIGQDWNDLACMHAGAITALISYLCCSVAKSCLPLRPRALQHARLLCPPLSRGVWSNLCSLSQWCYLTISSSAASFSICLQPFPASGCFPMSLLFTSGGQSIGTAASASVLQMNIQGWFPLGLTGLISLLSKGLSTVFSSTTIQNHKFFRAQPSLWSNSHICTLILEKPKFL